MTKALQRRYNKLSKFRGRNETYEIERTGVQQPLGEIFQVHIATSRGRSNNQQRNGVQSQRYNDRLGTERRGGSRETRGTFEGQSQVEAEKGNVDKFDDVENYYRVERRIDNSADSGKSGIDSNITRYRGKNYTVQQLDEITVDRRERTERDGSGNRGSSIVNQRRSGSGCVTPEGDIIKENK